MSAKSLAKKILEAHEEAYEEAEGLMTRESLVRTGR